MIFKFSPLLQILMLKSKEDPDVSLLCYYNLKILIITIIINTINVT